MASFVSFVLPPTPSYLKQVLLRMYLKKKKVTLSSTIITPEKFLNITTYSVFKFQLFHEYLVCLTQDPSKVHTFC